jgi:hypothetical protein
MINKKLTLLAGTIFLIGALSAQIEVSHLSTKGFSGFGFGGFLNFAVPVTEGDAVTIEAGVGLFGNSGYHFVEIPLLAGFRHLFNGTSDGFYVEPLVGYTIGGSDIQKTDSTGYPLTDANGNQIDQKCSGLTAGMAAGYIFPGRLAFNIAVRYEHIFVSGDPQINIISLRLSHTFSFGRRRDD